MIGYPLVCRVTAAPACSLLQRGVSLGRAPPKRPGQAVGRIDRIDYAACLTKIVDRLRTRGEFKIVDDDKSTW